MYERIKVKKLTPYIYLLNDMQEASGHLVVGKEKALDPASRNSRTYPQVATIRSL